MASANRPSLNSRRRTGSPLRSLSTAYDGVKTQNGKAAGSQQNGEWVEPPLRNPAPSFQDHPGITRQGVLEAMMPLGTLPTTKVKARAKGDPLRRVVQARNLSGLILDEGRVTPEAGAVSDSTRAGSLRTDGRSLRSSPAVETGLEVEEASSPSAQNNSSLETVEGKRQESQTTPTQNSPVQQTRQETPASRVAGIVAHSPVPTDSPYFTAVALANRNGSPEVQLPLAFLYNVAERDPELSRLLESAVKDGSINDPESHLYRKIKAVKKLFRSAQSSPRSRAGSTAAARGVSGAESRTETTRTSVSPSGANNNTIENAAKREPIHGQNQLSDHSHPSQTRPALRIKLNVNPTSSSTPPNDIPNSRTASPAKESVEEAVPRSRRSSSSSSSLSSADSDVLNQPPPTMEIPSKTRKRSSAEATPHEAEDPEVEAARKRMKLNIPEVKAKRSNIRKPPAAAASSQRAASQRASSRKTTPALRSHPPPDVLARDHENDVDDTVAPGKRSRQETPTALGRPPKKQKVAPRTKTSPVKNQKRPAVAGIARPESKRRGSVGNNADESESSDNHDYCSACGGPGYLLCCDGCDRSFHFSCLDPPFNSDEHFESKWFCSICEARREPAKKAQHGPQPGLFTELQNRIEKNNPRAFRLPGSLRDYYNNVKTGADGEYVDDPDTRAIPANNSRIGYDDAPNFKSLKDSKGNTILCHSCGKSSGGTRDIIPCDYCSLYWHLDCLDPPLANPPYRGPLQHEKKRYAWMCPAHTDHDLRNLDPIDGLGVRHDGDVRSHRVRRPKETKIMRTQLRRGLANNGLIEVESESSDDSGFESEEGLDGVIYKLPRNGIKLDFIQKVKMNRLKEEQQMREQNAAIQASILNTEAENARKLSQDIRSRQLRERQAAFNLAQFKTNNADLNLFEDEVENLIMTLEAEAPPEVTAMMEAAELTAMATDGKHGSRGLPSPASSSVPEISTAAPSGRQREVLLRMQAQIANLLATGMNDL